MFSHIVFVFGCLAAVIALVAPTPARADWYEVSGDYFVIYANAEEEDVARFADELERFHSLMEYSTGRDLPKPGPSNRITVYVTGSERLVRDLAGSSGVAGFYLPRWQGSLAFVPDVPARRDRTNVASRILLHEYVHHFFASTGQFAMPLWMNEGAAEYFSSVVFYKDGSVVAGLRPAHRNFGALWIDEQKTPVIQLLDLDWHRLKGRNAPAKDSFYANSWLLYHYLTRAEDRDGQLREYWIEVLKGTPSLEAARAVFGDIGVLQRQVDMHLRNRGAWYRIEADQLAIGSLDIRALDEGEIASIDIRIQLERGVSSNEAEELAARMRAIAQQFPDNVSVLTLLAQAEFAAGRDTAAITAADSALVLDATAGDAYVSKGAAAFRLARQLADPTASASAYELAMEPFLALQAIDDQHIAPLVYTYRYYSERNIAASKEAKAALVRATQLAPFDQELRLITGMMHMNDGRIAEARAVLAPLATTPHGGAKSEQVRALLGFLSDKPEGQAIPVQEAISGYFLSE